MYGLIVRLTSHDGKRDEMIDVLRESAGDMPGCICYVVAKDANEGRSIWVTEVWDSKESHVASLSLPAVRKAMTLGRELISSFEKIATTEPAWCASHATD
ncbi:MAG TPA: antibiotic biosynthesis monooxygenase [Gemmatimonadaceae bacterium]